MGRSVPSLLDLDEAPPLQRLIRENTIKYQPGGLWWVGISHFGAQLSWILLTWWMKSWWITMFAAFHFWIVMGSCSLPFWTALSLCFLGLLWVATKTQKRQIRNKKHNSKETKKQNPKNWGKCLDLEVLAWLLLGFLVFFGGFFALFRFFTRFSPATYQDLLLHESFRC